VTSNTTLPQATSERSLGGQWSVGYRQLLCRGGACRGEGQACRAELCPHGTDSDPL
jgi:hypothetical protein